MNNFEKETDANELYKARLASAEKVVEQARIELENAEAEGDIKIWQNRLAQRTADLERIKGKMDGNQEDIAA